MRPSNAADLTFARIGARGTVYSNRAASAATSTAAIIARQTPARVNLLLVNLSAFDIYVGPFPDVSATKGLLLSPAGGSLSLEYLTDLDLVSINWYAITAAASAAMLILETLIDANTEKAAQPAATPGVSQ